MSADIDILVRGDKYNIDIEDRDVDVYIVRPQRGSSSQQIYLRINIPIDFRNAQILNYVMRETDDLHATIRIVKE